MRNIKTDGEITFDYAMVLHKADKADDYKLNCLCDSPNCRGTITYSDWELPELQERYDGYFQWFLQEKVNRLRLAQI